MKMTSMIRPLHGCNGMGLNSCNELLKSDCVVAQSSLTTHLLGGKPHFFLHKLHMQVPSQRGHLPRPRGVRSDSIALPLDARRTRRDEGLYTP